MKKRSIILLSVLSIAMFTVTACGSKSTEVITTETTETTEPAETATEPVVEVKTDEAGKGNDNIVNGTDVDVTDEDLGEGGTVANSGGLDGPGVSEDTLNNISVEEESNITDAEKSSSDYKVEQIPEKKMYAIDDCYIRKGPSTEYEPAGNLSKNDKVTVNGKVTYKDKVWYKLKTKDGSDKYVVSTLLKDVESKKDKDTDTKDTKDDSKKDTSSNNNSGSSNNSSSSNNSNSGSSNNSSSNSNSNSGSSNSGSSKNTSSNSGKKDKDKDKNSSSGSNKNTSSNSGKKDKDKNKDKDKDKNNNNSSDGGFDFDPNSSEVAPEDDYGDDDYPDGVGELTWN